MDTVDPDLYYKAARQAAKAACKQLDDVSLIEWDNVEDRFCVTFSNGFSIFCTLDEAENGYSRVH